MKTYISDIIPKLQTFSKKLDDETLLTKQHWVAIDETSNSKNVYIFRKNNELLISQNGKVEKAKWEYLGHNSLLIDRKDESYLYKHGFFDENILALKVDSTNEFAILVNENQFEIGLNSIQRINKALSQKYVNTSPASSVVKSIKTPSIASTIEYIEEKLADGKIIKIERRAPYKWTNGVTVYDTKGNPLKDGSYLLAKQQILIVKNSRIERKYFPNTSPATSVVESIKTPSIVYPIEYLKEKLVDGKIIKIERRPPYRFSEGVSVYDRTGLPLNNGNYLLSNGRYLHVENGKIFKRYFIQSYRINDSGIMRLQQADVNRPQPGDEIFDTSWGTSSISGEYKINWLTKIVVNRGVVTKVSLF